MSTKSMDFLQMGIALSFSKGFASVMAIHRRQNTYTGHSSQEMFLKNEK